MARVIVIRPGWNRLTLLPGLVFDAVMYAALAKLLHAIIAFDRARRRLLVGLAVVLLLAGCATTTPPQAAHPTAAETPPSCYRTAVLGGKPAEDSTGCRVLRGFMEAVVWFPWGWWP